MELREYIRLVLTPDAKVDASTVESVGGAMASRAAVAGAFVTAVERRFEATPSREDIAAVVSRVREHYVDGDRLPPMLGEALVRVAFGDESFLTGISDEELTRGQLMLTYGIVHDLGLKGQGYEDFLTEATRTAQEILTEEGA
jgi:hypothetical protein